MRHALLSLLSWSCLHQLCLLFLSLSLVFPSPRFPQPLPVGVSRCPWIPYCPFLIPQGGNNKAPEHGPVTTATNPFLSFDVFFVFHCLPYFSNASPIFPNDYLSFQSVERCSLLSNGFSKCYLDSHLFQCRTAAERSTMIN